jgi:hypothetical protein
LIQADVDLEWTPVRVFVYPLLALFAGMFAGMLGMLICIREIDFHLSGS